MENFSILRFNYLFATIEIQFLFRFVEILENKKKKIFQFTIYNFTNLLILYKFELINDRIIFDLVIESWSKDFYLNSKRKSMTIYNLNDLSIRFDRGDRLIQICFP